VSPGHVWCAVKLQDCRQPSVKSVVVTSGLGSPYFNWQEINVYLIRSVLNLLLIQ